MKEVMLKNLTSGMIIAKNVYDFKQNIILPEGYVLTNKTIIKLTFHGVDSVFVEDQSVQEMDRMFANHRPSSYHVKRSPEFQRFAVDFEKDVRNFQSSMNAVVEKHSPLDINELMRNTLALLDNTRGKIHIFEILHNMRQFDDSTYAHCINVALISSNSALLISVKSS